MPERLTHVGFTTCHSVCVTLQPLCKDAATSTLRQSFNTQATLFQKVRRELGAFFRRIETALDGPFILYEIGFHVAGNFFSVDVPAPNAVWKNHRRAIPPMHDIVFEPKLRID